MMELNKMLRAKFKKSLGVEGEVIPDEPIVTTPTQEQPQDETLPPGYYQERELVKLMLLYGGRTLTIKQQDELGQEVEEQVPVAQMIVDDLITDNIEFNDPVNRKIFEIYDQALNTEELPNDQFFTSNEDEQVSQVAIDLVTTQYKLDGWERHGIFVKKEEDILKKAVQYAILRYKDQIIDARRKEIQDQIKEEPDPDNQLILLKKKKHWDDLRVQINKMLGIVIAK